MQILRVVDKMRLNLACGNKKLLGFVNIDVNPRCNPDVVYDVLNGIPYRNNSVDEIVCDNFIEHIPVPKLIPFIEDMWRVCRNGAVITILTAHGGSWQVYHDPTHVRGFSCRSFDYFVEGNKMNYYSKARFNIRTVKLIYASSGTRRFWYAWTRLMNFLGNIRPFFTERIWAGWFGGFEAVYFELEVVK
jgi:SAM-dependent methyltransferase